MPWPSRMRLVRAAAAARNTSGCRTVRVLFEKVVLDRPGIVEAEPVCERDLRERLLHELALVVGTHGLGSCSS